jgi:prepilin-type N-terminal cleavage/methylation domain-containing protein
MFTKLKNSRRESDRGFTIIEVMIVLAIAGLILLIVFLAVPALQRNSRNTQRKNDASHLASLITEYQSNNNGSNPSSVVFSGSPSAGQLDATTEKFSILDTSSNITLTTRPASPGAPATDTAVIYTRATCSGAATTAGTSTRQVVVYYYLEGSTTSGCVQD